MDLVKIGKGDKRIFQEDIERSYKYTRTQTYKIFFIKKILCKSFLIKRGGTFYINL